MRYPWVCLSICSVWIAALAVILFHIAEPMTLYIYTTATVVILFLLGFARS